MSSPMVKQADAGCIPAGGGAREWAWIPIERWGEERYRWVYGLGHNGWATFQSEEGFDTEEDAIHAVRLLQQEDLAHAEIRIRIGRTGHTRIVE
jgi:hypothetical protein